MYNSDGSIFSKNTSIYHDKSNNIENGYNSDGKLDYKLMNKYDVNRNLIERNGFNSKGNLTYTIIKKYDIKGISYFNAKIYQKKK